MTAATSTVTVNRFRTAIGAIAISMAVATAPHAVAHAGHDKLLRINVEKDMVRLSLSLDGDQLLAFDSNGDGKLSKTEFLVAFGSISIWIDERIDFVGRDNRRTKATFSDLPITGFEQLGDTDDVEHIRVLRSYPVGKGQVAMMIRFNLFDDANSSRHYAVWNAGKVSEGVLTPESNVVIFGSKR